MRTDNLKDFADDFFLPTFVNYSSKINNFALKFFASIVAIAFDFVTLPLRLLTTPFQIYYNRNCREENHPVFDLIKKNSFAQRAIKDNVVNLCYKIEDVQMKRPIHLFRTSFQNATKSVVKGTIQIALKRVPGGIKSQTSEELEETFYLRRNGGWIAESFSSRSSSHSSFAC